MALFRLAVLISGSGSTLRNLLERSADGRLRAQVCGVAASRDCPGLDHARDFGVPWVVVPRVPAGQPGPFDAAEYSGRMTAALDAWQPGLIALAGFLSPYIPAPHYERRVLNVHPAQLPHFGGPGMYGRRVHEAVLASGTKLTGCTVHLVDDQYDHGAILAQRAVAVVEGDTPGSLGERVMQAERELYPEVINWFADGRVAWDVAGRPVVSGRAVIPQG